MGVVSSDWRDTDVHFRGRVRGPELLAGNASDGACPGIVPTAARDWGTEGKGMVFAADLFSLNPPQAENMIS